MDGWIQTASGRAMYPLAPRVQDVCIEDVAHALAMQTRFTGHCRSFYSIAQHSVLVSRVCERKDALWGLLHDASEAYLSDVSRPVKRLPELAAYRDAEKSLQAVICLRFGLPEAEPPSVKRADTILLGIEARDLMSPLTHQEHWAWALDTIGDCPIRIDRTWGPEEAEERFLARFRELTTGSDLGAAARLLAGARRKGRTLIERARGLFDGDGA